MAKFYRPQRWTDEAIIEEHQFSQELVDAGLSVVAPLARDGCTLFHHAGFRFALFPRPRRSCHRNWPTNPPSGSWRKNPGAHARGRIGRYFRTSTGPGQAVTGPGVRSVFCSTTAGCAGHLETFVRDPWPSMSSRRSIPPGNGPARYPPCVSTATVIPAISCGATTRPISSTSTTA